MRTHLKGIPKMERRLAIELRKIKSDSIVGLIRAGRFLRRESNENAPKVTGFLVNSSFVAPINSHSNRIDSKASVVVGYSAVYARRVHEIPRTGKTGGLSPSGKKYKKGTWSEVGGWKFLERAFKQNIRQILKLIASK